MSATETLPYRRTPQGRIDQVKTFGSFAVERVQKAESRLDSLEDGKLLQLRANVVGQLVKYAEGDLKGEDQADTFKRQSALNMILCETGEILGGRGVAITKPAEVSPILERLELTELDRMGRVLAGRVDALLNLPRKGMKTEDRDLIGRRAAMLGGRLKTLGVAYYKGVQNR